jgi:hypothetical protein
MGSAALLQSTPPAKAGVARDKRPRSSSAGQRIIISTSCFWLQIVVNASATRRFVSTLLKTIKEGKRDKD